MNTHDIQKAIQTARETLQKEKANLQEQARILPLVIAGLESVAHHSKVTSRVRSAVAEKIPGYTVSLQGDHIYIWGKDIGWEQRLSIYGDGLSVDKFIEGAKARLTQFSTESIDKTLGNLDTISEFIRSAKQIQQSIERELPALHYLRGVRYFNHLYDFKCACIPE